MILTKHQAPGTRHRKIGLLGGSFNPAHAGHVQVSLTALRQLGLDEVWWLVSPQNPLKPKAQMADYETRLKKARTLTASHKSIRVSDIERKLNTRYSYDTVRMLNRKFPHMRFVWLMGADNLAQFHRWRRWQQLFNLLPIVVFDRAPFSHPALRAKAALRFGFRRLKEAEIQDIAGRQTPSWGYIFMQKNPTSSSFLRKTLGKKAFL